MSAIKDSDNGWDKKLSTCSSITDLPNEKAHPLYSGKRKTDYLIQKIDVIKIKADLSGISSIMNYIRVLHIIFL
ncbi:hypothetical protein [Peribacillus asahii]|uniref:hypothetical protein n=1 Tax=Peribacillus asahii TaxID=228899 RepID=UPI002079E378|nr:hypothetical protein [Peribacillus asahii]USK61682.1 hypothetical protein LIT37_10385 [Peribacillus asahii]